MSSTTNFRYRLTFGKHRHVKYVAHLDLVLAWTRAFRRAQIPLAYSKGFSAHARIQVAMSLPLGYTGSAELMDIYLREAMLAEEILESVGQTLPKGFSLSHVESVERKAPALQSLITQATYRVLVETDLPAEDLQARTELLLGQEEIIAQRIRRRKQETFDMRPLLHDLSLHEKQNGDAIFHMRLSAGANGNLRPNDVLTKLGLEEAWAEFERTKLII